ncbi:RING-H2 finger protein ATL11-like [Juglans microcarpa x Juglans regia]|uniref:RING-H2 finger protein ATL11-like n=1 Tax=Juglans microcarpa x Juglans regia TaxID=2249226 RepID=UPI001B7E0378|nr:RING-H2 finger protein ATL11-like [Juglans microcarpa x Juglans regia]
MAVQKLLNFSFQGIAWVVVELLVLLQMSLLAAAQNGTELQGQQSQGSLDGFELDKRIARIMVIIVSVIFFLGFFCVYVRQCTNSISRGRFDLANITAGRNALRSRFARGLGADTIKTFPTFLYSTVKGLKMGKGSLECAVCLNEFEDEEILRLLPKCSHAFHADCIDAWLASHSTCPVCRTNLVPEPGEIPSAVLHIPDPEIESGQPEQRSDTEETHAHVADSDKSTIDSEAASVNLVNHTRGKNQDRPVTGSRLTGIFQRSHSTGHSLVPPDEKYERFTLRLPEDVRSRLISSTLNRTNSCLPFPRERSSVRGYRSASGGIGNGRNHLFYERFDRSDRWRFTFTPNFISRTGSVRSPKSDMDYAGERSTDRLHPDSQV